MSDLNFIQQEMEARYDFPAKVFKIEKNLHKEPFYIVKVENLLNLCGTNYIFKKFSNDVLAEN
jgi:hypothetical protein